MDRKSTFYTLKGYQRVDDPHLTPALEDYLEMICRLSDANTRVRVRELAGRLHVSPSSASKMIRQLCELGYLSAERYGDITLLPSGRAAGDYLLYRHGVIHRFLCFLNQSRSEVEETEKIEHFLCRRTVENLDLLLKQLENGGLGDNPTNT